MIVTIVNPRHNLELLPSAQGEKIHTASAQKLTRVIQYGGLVRRWCLPLLHRSFRRASSPSSLPCPCLCLCLCIGGVTSWGKWGRGRGTSTDREEGEGEREVDSGSCRPRWPPVSFVGKAPPATGLTGSTPRTL